RRVLFRSPYVQVLGNFRQKRRLDFFRRNPYRFSGNSGASASLENLRASILATIICSVWYSITGSRIKPVFTEFTKSTLAITVPCTSDFLEPQNIAVILSSRLKCKALEIRFTRKSTSRKKPTKPKPKKITFQILKPANIFCENDSLKEV